MAPMPNSRMPKCRVRPYGPPRYSSVCLPAGMKLGAPAMVVLLDPARSAEPPQSSGRTAASAFSTVPEADRVATPLGSAGNVGKAAARSAGSFRATRRSVSYTHLRAHETVLDLVCRLLL